MTGSRRSGLTRDEQENIAEAVRAAEARTSGEIVVLVSARAGFYRSIGLALALVCGLAVPWPLIAFTGWSAATIFLVQAIAMLAAVLLTFESRLRIALVPRRVRRERAHEAARREFLARGLTRTRERTGVLIYVALAERYAEIVADEGVRARVPDATWSAAVTALLGAAGRGDLAGGLITAVSQVGTILAAELPPGAAGDELPNRVIVID